MVFLCAGTAVCHAMYIAGNGKENHSVVFKFYGDGCKSVVGGIFSSGICICRCGAYGANQLDCYDYSVNRGLLGKAAGEDVCVKRIVVLVWDKPGENYYVWDFERYFIGQER